MAYQLSRYTGLCVNLTLRALFVAFIALCFAGTASAATFFSGDSVLVVPEPNASSISGNVYAAGSTILQRAPVEGDFIAAGRLITLSHGVRDDVILAGQTIIIHAPVGGDLRVAGQSIFINADVAGEVIAMGQEIVIGENVTVGGDLIARGSTITLEGNVQGESDLSGAEVTLAGTYANVTVAAEHLALLQGAMISGNLNYSVGNEPENLEAVKGRLIKHAPPRELSPDEEKPSFLTLLTKWILHTAFSYLSFLVVGFLLLRLFKKQVQETTHLITEKTGATILIGAGTLLLVPLSCLAIALTIVGVPLALIIFALYSVLLYCARLFLAVLAGAWLLPRKQRYVQFALGWFIVLLFASIPLIGGMVKLAGAVTGLGALVLWTYQVHTARKKQK